MSRLWAVVVVLALALACRDRTNTKQREEEREGDNVTVYQPDAGIQDPRPPVDELPTACPPVCTPTKPTTIGRAPSPNPIPAENTLPGHAGWRSGRSANGGEVELYASLDSAQAGEAVAVRVSTSAPLPVTAEVYRVGYYGGAGARRVWSGGPFQARKQPSCPRDPATALVECAWADTFSFTVGADWVSGIYLIKVSRPDGYKRFTPLVVRDARSAELLFGVAFNTYQAYNAWGGESLYQDASGTMPLGRAYQVSYERPYFDDEGLGKCLRWELPFVQFLERHGYDVTYATNLDFVRYSDVVKGVGAFVHGGQDEYWNAEQRNQLEVALQQGGMSLAYFGGNGGYWRTRVLASSRGAELRTLSCYKNEPDQDPIPNSTIRFRDEPNAQPESLLFGTMYDGWQLIPFPLVVKDPSHWLFEGTGVHAGEQLVGLLGFEFDKVFGPEVTPPGLSISMHSPVITAEGLPSVSHAVDRTLPSGRLVFSAGSIYWPNGLGSDPEVRDGRVERMTLNVLERALTHRRPARPLPLPAAHRPPVFPPDARWAPDVSALAGVPGSPGHHDGPAAEARFDGPTGLGATALGQVIVADTNNNRLRLVDVDEARTVSTIAGTGALGLRDGPGAQAQFRRPTGVAVGPDGAVYVADSDNHVIRRLDRTANGWVVSTHAGGGRSAGSTDGPPHLAKFRRPTALAVDAAGNVYVADQAGHRIRMIAAVTREVSTLAGGGIGFVDAPLGAQARFNNPSAITVAPTGELYVFDSGNQRVRRIAADPTRAVTTIAGAAERAMGYRDGAGSVARFRAQLGMAYSPYDEVMIADTANFRIRKVVPGLDAATTSVFTIAGNGRLGTALGSGDVAEISAPAGLAFLPDERIAVADAANHVLRIITR